ncbi:class I SAM-dependent methyltransferase [Planctomycetaceae bacterium SH139]
MSKAPQVNIRVRPPDWKLPPGVAPGTWDYAHSDSIADDYEAFLASTPLAQLDLSWLADMLPKADRPAAMVADLGCGTGRSAEPLRQLGYRLLGIDLSQQMLRHAAQQGATWSPAMRPLLVRANLVTLDCLASGCVDHAICLFSTLGMVRSRAHRREVLRQVARIVRPAGRLLLHCHNRWAALRDPGGMAHLWRSWWHARRDPVADFGDRTYAYRGLPNMYLHSFGRRELALDLKAAGLRVERMVPLRIEGDRQLPAGWFFGGLRAGGFMVLARRTADTGSAAPPTLAAK